MMAPLPVTDLADLLDIESGIWTPLFFQETSTTAGGEMLAADLGPTLWSSKIQTRPMSLPEARRIRAVLASIGSVRSFYYWSPDSQGPALDPRCLVLGSYTPVISDWDTEASTIDITGLPPNYRLSAGDMASYDYGTPARRALIAFAEALEASPGGDITGAAIAPALRPGLAAVTPLRLSRPAAKVRIRPGTVSIQNSGGKHAKISLEVVSTLEAG